MNILWTLTHLSRLIPNLVCQKVNFHLLAALAMGVNLDVSGAALGISTDGFEISQDFR